MYVRVPDESALIRYGVGGRRLFFCGAWVIPILHKAEFIDLTRKKVRISRTEKEAVSCRDGIRADLSMDFFVQIIKEPKTVLEVCERIGPKRAGDEGVVRQLFEAKFLEAIKRCARARSFDEIIADRDRFRDGVIEAIGDELNGYELDGCGVVSLDETALEFLDPQNLIDAEGIKKITDCQAREDSLRRAAERERKKEEAIERAKRKEG